MNIKHKNSAELEAVESHPDELMNFELNNDDTNVISCQDNNSLDLNSSQITVSVRCEIGEVNLSLADLYNLKIGDSVDFMRWPGFVKLSANNVIFAEGVLVEVNGLLAVKITKSLQKIHEEV